LRAGPLSDERVRRLLNRRFVPFYFDIFGGHAGDADARAVITRQRPELARNPVGVNPILFLLPDGEIVAEISAGEATRAALLDKLEQVLRDHPDRAAPAPGEAAIDDPIARAELCIDLRHDDEADRLLATVAAPRAHYLRGRLARFRGDFAAMRAQFAKAESADLADDVRMETAYALWDARDYGALAEHLAEFPRDSSRFTEARYYEGLALYHSGRTQAARARWKATIEACPQDPWVYRMDWAWADTAADFGAPSPLRRIGYLGAYRNPDVFRAR
jgi:hypothetical protein